MTRRWQGRAGDLSIGVRRPATVARHQKVTSVGTVNLQKSERGEVSEEGST